MAATAGITGVGIIGASARRGWAAAAHVPALHALSQYELRAVSASSQSSADEAAASFGVPIALDNHAALVRRPEVDLVVVSVKVPHHRELATAALEAGKSVYCEWPLARDLVEAQALSELASRMEAATVVGLQGRATPAILYLRDLVAEGQVGEILSTTMIGSSRPGAEIDEADAYLADRANGANLLTIAVGHAVDTLCFCLGEIQTLSAVLQTRRPFLTVRESGERIVKTSPDQTLIAGQLQHGTPVSVHFREGLEGGTGLLWEINGTEGTLQVTAEGGLPGIYPLKVLDATNASAPVPLPIPERYWTGELAGLVGTPAHNVGCVYAAFANDRSANSHTSATFADAAARHGMIATIERAASDGAQHRVRA